MNVTDNLVLETVDSVSRMQRKIDALEKENAELRQEIAKFSNCDDTWVRYVWTKGGWCREFMTRPPS